MAKYKIDLDYEGGETKTHGQYTSKKELKRARKHLIEKLMKEFDKGKVLGDTPIMIIYKDKEVIEKLDTGWEYVVRTNMKEADYNKFAQSIGEQAVLIVNRDSKNRIVLDRIGGALRPEQFKDAVKEHLLSKLQVGDLVEAMQNGKRVYKYEMSKSLYDKIHEKNKKREEHSIKGKEISMTPHSSMLSAMDKKVAEVEAMLGSLDEIKKNLIGEEVISCMSEVMNIAKQIMGSEPHYKLDDEGNIILDSMDKPEIVRYRFETFDLKQLIDFQFMLSGYLAPISFSLAEFKGKAGLRKAQVDIATNYVYQEAKDYILEELKEKRTDKFIQSVISNRPEMINMYAQHRTYAVISMMLETTYKVGELMRNVLNSTIDYMKTDMVNSIHLAKSEVPNQYFSKDT